MQFVIDTGTGKSIIGGLFFDSYLQDQIEIKPNARKIYAANGQEMKVMEQCKLPTKLGNTEKEAMYWIVMDIRMEIILGTEMMKDWEMKINFKKEIIQIGLEEIMVTFQREIFQWVQLTETVVVWPNKWIPARMKMPKGEINKIRRIETSWRLNLKNKEHVIPGIVRDQTETIV